MTNGHPSLPSVHVGYRRRVEESENRGIEAREIAARDGSADYHRRDRLRHRLQGVEVAAPIEGMPPRVVVVIRTGILVGVERAPHMHRVVICAIVVLLIAAIVDQSTAANNDHAIDVAVASGGDFGVDAVEYRDIESDRLR